MDTISKDLNKAILISFVFLLAGTGAWLYVRETGIAPERKPIRTSAEAVEAVTSGEIAVGSNPVDNKVPEVNPVDLANPFKNAYKNPFE